MLRRSFFEGACEGVCEAAAAAAQQGDAKAEVARLEADLETRRSSTVLLPADPFPSLNLRTLEGCRFFVVR